MTISEKNTSVMFSCPVGGDDHIRDDHISDDHIRDDHIIDDHISIVYLSGRRR